jgi:hypothetical protein
LIGILVASSSRTAVSERVRYTTAALAFISEGAKLPVATNCAIRGKALLAEAIPTAGIGLVTRVSHRVATGYARSEMIGLANAL